MKVLALNAGSNSLKFEIVELNRSGGGAASTFGSTLISGVYDDIGKEHSSFALLENKQARVRNEVEVRDHGHATEQLFEWLDESNAQAHGVSGLADIERVGHRVVHGGDRFHEPTMVTEDLMRCIEDLEELAPLHNRPAVAVIRAAQARVNHRTPMFAVFDTAFHRSIPDLAARYPLPADLAERHKIRRYGFHGISHRYLMLRYGQISGRAVDELNLITLHLEGGSSAAAIRDGKSVDTSMGFTPLEGLMMGTRCGDIDPAIVVYLMRKENLDADGVENLLNKKSGLLGVSGLSADTRELRDHVSESRVNLALDMFCYRVRKYVGAYLAALGGADAIVVGGGIGENTPLVRERIFEHFGWCGALLDGERNRAIVDSEGPITTRDSRLQIWVIPTQEGRMIAREVATAKSS